MSQQINLFNPIFLKQKKHFSSVTMVQALGIILAGCLLMYGYSVIQLKERQKEAGSTADQLIRTKDQLLSVSTNVGQQKKDEKLDDEIVKVQTDIKSMQDIFDAIQSGRFGDTKGYSSYFRGFARQIVDGIWLSNISIDGAAIDIGLKGHALKAELIPAYLTRLEHEEGMHGKSFAALTIDPPGEAGPSGQNPAASDSAKPKPAYVDFDLQSTEAAAGGKK